jgi:hypothetical protein
MFRVVSTDFLLGDVFLIHAGLSELQGIITRETIPSGVNKLKSSPRNRPWRLIAL